VIIEDWRIDHNVNRHLTHTAHGEFSRSEFAAELTINQPQAESRLDQLPGPLIWPGS
jgi:hypothetical protein